MTTALLRASSIEKRFAGVHALKGVSFELFPGEVHALVGENGAGKSTLVKIITGAETADSGTLVVSGSTVDQMDPERSRALGIAAIYQQPSLFPHLTVAENIALALEPARGWRRVDWEARRRQAARLLDRIGAAIDPDRLVQGLSMPEQQLVEIAKAIGGDANVLIMDEPTASLTAREVDRLFEVIDRVRVHSADSADRGHGRHGAGVIYISHRLDEVFAIADRVTILRDGQAVATRRKDDIDRSELVRLMVGRELQAVFPKRRVPLGDVALELRGLSNRAAGLQNVSLSVGAGEILGLAGLVGSGRTELAETVFGLRSADAGEIRIRQARVRIGSPSDAIRLGVGYVPEDRRHHGIVPEMSVAANASLANLRAISRRGLIDHSLEREAATRHVQELRINTPSVWTDVGSLSGGNQQKVALARWLSINPSVLILDEPTQGVDVGSKSEIHEIMERLVERGAAIVMISSELPEILGMSDRIAVMRQGSIVGILDRAEATQHRVLAMALGQPWQQ